MTFEEYCYKLKDAQDFPIKMSRSLPVTFSNSKGVTFSVPQEEIFNFLKIFYIEYEKKKEYFPLNSYEEKKFRLFYKSFPEESVSTINQLGGSQTKGLTSLIEKLICFKTNQNYIGLRNLHFSREDLELFFKKNEVFDVNKISVSLTGKISLDDFLADVRSCGLIFNNKLIYRYLSALLSKQFVLLTGLSGSGKTKIAEAFSYWISNSNSGTAKLLFKKGSIIDSKKTQYRIVESDRLGLIIQGDKETNISLPFDLIQSWIEIIEENNFNEDTPSQEIQSKVKGKKNVNSTLNSFHSPLKAVAFHVLKNKRALISNNTKQICFVSVGADWTNREPLLGFPNALDPGKYVSPDTGVLELIINAHNDSLNPYFLILDEMNLSHVERYFADFLSAMESKTNEINLHPDTEEWKNSEIPAKISLPKNLFIIGTVNIDETTYMFSPKVLDRANVIEFHVSEEEMNFFFDNNKEIDLDILAGTGSCMGKSFVEIAKEFAQDDGNLKDELMPFFRKLQEAGAEFGYRTASEIGTFVKKCTDLVNGEMTRNEIVDAAIMQKLLPKLHGSRNKIERILKDLGNLCLQSDTTPDFPESAIENIKYPVSYEKLKRMHKRVISDGFTSYAEA